MHQSNLNSLFVDVVQLTQRLPELERKLNQLVGVWNLHVIPSGLFKCAPNFTTQNCINEVRENLSRLAKQTNLRSARVLADLISQQITVLVHICTAHAAPKNKPKNFSVSAISTRQQRLEELTAEIKKLTEQQQSILATIQQQKAKKNVIIGLEKELGELQRELTLAQEKLSFAGG
jgi:hypothetical protein